MAIERITGIVTDLIRHNDRHNIISLFTRELGRVSLLVPAGGGKSGRMRNARLQPLSVIESDVNFRAGKSLQNLGSVALKEIWRDLYFHPVKSAIVMFLCEFLNRYLRESSPEPLLWDYVVEALRELDGRKKGLSNFHLAFLTGFLHFAGISPDLSELERGDYFDMQAGIAVAERPSHRHYLFPPEAGFLPLLMRMNFNNDFLFRFQSGERRMVLRKILEYYAVHYPGMAAMKSPAILEDIFS
ncbi:MAG: DNA repair protein RecO C-terminal domain-containing protein [Muribaculaceae bacterium]|nr:DNA repair protein RecO C-terminal domain-containing protein [Muribaculaceae bacterium]